MRPVAGLCRVRRWVFGGGHSGGNLHGGGGRIEFQLERWLVLFHRSARTHLRARTSNLQAAVQLRGGLLPSGTRPLPVKRVPRELRLRRRTLRPRTLRKRRSVRIPHAWIHVPRRRRCSAVCRDLRRRRTLRIAGHRVRLRWRDDGWARLLSRALRRRDALPARQLQLRWGVRVRDQRPVHQRLCLRRRDRNRRLSTQRFAASEIPAML